MTTSDRTWGGWLLLGAVIAVGLNLRGPIVAVAPVLEDLQRDLGITETAAGLLTAAPVLCFAVISPLVAVIARRIGINRTVAVSLLVLAFAIAVRPWSGFGLMMAGTLLVGVAIAAGNVLLPVVVRRDFSARTEPVMSAATTSLLVSASIPAVFTVPLALLMGWRAALAVWAALSVATLAFWWIATGRARRREAATVSTAATPHGPPAAGAGGAGVAGREQPADVATGVTSSAWGSLAAWELGVFFGLQSLLFYATTAWLPTMLRAHGDLTAAAAGTALSLFQIFGIAGAIAAPLLIRRGSTRYPTVTTLAGMWLVFLVGVLVVPAAWPVLCTIGGVAQGAGIAVAFSLIAVRSSSSDAARSVSAVVQTIGYFLGAAGPVVVGGIVGVTVGWTAPFSVLIVVSVMLGVVGVRSAAPRPIR
jgi:MFS transporter, CP family, cyanate transporter